MAGPTTERWEDGVTSRPPAGAHATVEAIALPLGSSGFADVNAGLGTQQDLGPGGGVSVSTSGVMAPGVAGPLSYVRLGGASAWASWVHPWGRQAVSIGYYRPVFGERSHFRFHPSETEQRLVLRYSVRLQVGRVEVSGEPRIGIAEGYPEFTHTAAVAVPLLADRFAVTAGVTAGVAPLGTALVGVHARPAKGVEIGVLGGSAFPILRPLRGPDLQVGLQLKVWGAAGE